MAAPIYYDASRVRPEVFAMAARQSRVTLAEYQDLRLNGHERLLLYRHLDDEALAWALELCATGYGAPFGLHRVPTTHPDLGLCVLAPILTARLRERHAAAAQIADSTWHPIETAPKDGQVVLLGAVGHSAEPGAWHSSINHGAGGWNYGVTPLSFDPTHWRAYEGAAQGLAPATLSAGALSAEDLVKACANVGVDLTCGACASVFYTGAAPGTPHDAGCKSARSPAMSAEDWTKAADELATTAVALAPEGRPLIEVFDEAKAQRELPTDRELLEAWFRAKLNPRYEDVPLWVLVMEAFTTGSTRAHEICRQFGQDPDQKVPGHGDEDGVCGACGAWCCPNCENLSHVSEGSAPKCDHCEEENEEEDA